MTIGLLKEELPERRVALLPEGVNQTAGASILPKEGVFESAGFLIKIQPPDIKELGMMKEGQVFMAAFNPMVNIGLVNELCSKNITSFSLDILPRTTRAQAMDILSSMATVAGYKAVLTAANNLPKFFPMFMTAAGTVTPAKVLILGAGVAGLQAIATSRKLGAVVEVFDVRAAVKEEVTGLGGKFIDVEGATDDKAAGGYAVEQNEEFKKRQAQAIHDHAIKSDAVICTAQIPGKKAPLLLRKETVEAMKPGAVVIDLAASSGGNCELTKDNETVIHGQIKIIGNSAFASDMPSDASKMFGKNVVNFLKLMFNNKGEFNLNWEDDLIKGSCVTHNKEIVSERVNSVTK
ncbi:MAG: NAD(P) transhydrogenase subunit alpha [Bacteroidetes bacterium]|nr:NAD(P) transhydrogenase subunit alpha [Bacteroidota bacterium]